MQGSYEAISRYIFIFAVIIFHVSFLMLKCTPHTDRIANMYIFILTSSCECALGRKEVEMWRGGSLPLRYSHSFSS